MGRLVGCAVARVAARRRAAMMRLRIGSFQFEHRSQVSESRPGAPSFVGLCAKEKCNSVGISSDVSFQLCRANLKGTAFPPRQSLDGAPGEGGGESDCNHEFVHGFLEREVQPL